MKRALLVITKRPQAGQTKTRLSPPLLPEQAAQLYECFLRDTLDLTRQVPDVNRFILYFPLHESLYFQKLAPDFKLLAQEGTNLGERLNNALTHTLDNGFEQVVIINSDGPTLPPAHIKQAFNMLTNSEAVFGPAIDGGYYLIGLTRPQPRLVLEVKMSTPSVLQDTLAIAQEEKIEVSLLPEWYDIDTINDLKQLRPELQGLSNGVAQHTRQFLISLANQMPALGT